MNSIEVFRNRPFKIRNADEYNLSDILSLFVNPVSGLSSPIDFENSIIKGRMGSGKTMFLRANYAYYLFNLVPRLIDDTEIILPVFIRLSDFHNIKEPDNIYKEIIIKIVEEISTVYLTLQNAKTMCNIHCGMKKLPRDVFFENKIEKTTKHLLKLGAEEYFSKISSELNFDGDFSHSFFKASAKFHKSQVEEIKHKKNPGIKDIVLAYETLLKDSGGKLLILIDEAGAVDRSFFKSSSNDSFFEILMNQLRTADFIRTKIAVYPNSFSDILTETRYGDIIMLEERMDSNQSYLQFRQKVLSIIENYINVENERILIKASDIFNLNKSNYNDCLEQIINGSGGNYRRLIQLLDSSMNEAFIRDGGFSKIEIVDAHLALKKHCESYLSTFTDTEKEFINNISKACRNRGTFKFKFPNNAPLLYKYMTKSEEFNIVKISEAGSGRKGATYSFDYSYSLLQDIPTHHLIDTERIDRNRSLISGIWINRVANVTQEILAQTEIPGKLEGELSWYQGQAGFIKSDDNVDYFFTKDNIISDDSNKKIWIGKRLRFYPSLIGETKVAWEIEII
jgi:hypothetical protein